MPLWTDVIEDVIIRDRQETGEWLRSSRVSVCGWWNEWYDFWMDDHKTEETIH